LENTMLTFEKPPVVENYAEQMEAEKTRIIDFLRETVPLLAYMPDSQFYKIDAIGNYPELYYNDTSFDLNYIRNVLEAENLETITYHRQALENGEGFIFEKYLDPMGWTCQAHYASENLPPLTAEQTETLYEIQGRNNHREIEDIMTSLYPELTK